MSDRGLQEIPAFLLTGGLIAVVSAALLGIDPHSIEAWVWVAGWMIVPWVLFITALQLDWYRKRGEWL